jgi:ABC-type branched-subunit amino acid transport system substrate-binding protein
MQAKAYLEYIKKHHKGKQIILIRDKGHFDKTFGAALEAELKTAGIEHTVRRYEQYQTWGNLIGDKETVLVHCSNSKTKATYTVNSLLPNEKKVTLMAPDSWMDFTSVDYSFWKRLNIEFISTNLATIHNEQSKTVARYYRQDYKGDPSMYTYKGYDHMLFSAELLNAFGKYFPVFITDRKFEYSNTAFKLVKAGNCLHNKYIQTFTFEEDRLTAVKMD